MDFQSVNPLNVKLNMISGNLLPMTTDSAFPVFWQVYTVLVWLLQLVRMSGLIRGFIFVSKNKDLMNSLVSIMLTAEVIFLNVQIQRHGKLVRRFILKLNDVLSVEDEVMKNIVTATIKPIQILLNLYWIISLLTTVIWAMIPFTLVFKKSSFYYVDYRMPLVFGGEPFSTRVFVLGSVLILIVGPFVVLKKTGTDIYIVHLVLLMTTQYRYIAIKLGLIFHKGGRTR